MSRQDGRGSGIAAVLSSERIAMVAGTQPPVTARLRAVIPLAVHGLPQMRLGDRREYAQTVRAIRTPAGAALRAEGSNLRYAAIVALGTGRMSGSGQREALAGTTAADLAADVARGAMVHGDAGAAALAAWASAEVAGIPDARLAGRLAGLLEHDGALPTVECAWMLDAALATVAATCSRDGETYLREADESSAAGRAWAAIARARERLLQGQSPNGLFPHALPAATLGRLRAHVGCFADQVYPIQALARLAAARSDCQALAAANRAADRICHLQGPAGQWWWHYDVRDGSVVEPYPVYSVHQHAMAPMALLDLLEAGGEDHRESVARGVGWLDVHPEVFEELVTERWSVVWRKVGRVEPRKAARTLAAAVSAVRPGAHVHGLDRVLPPTRVDHECRPYELGWLLYAWLSGGVVRALTSERVAAHV